MWRGDGMTRHDPVTGPENPIAPPVEYTAVDSHTIEAVTTLGLPYQGPPSCVHGGVSALILDHTLGVANGWAGVSGVTAELTIRYHELTRSSNRSRSPPARSRWTAARSARRARSRRTAKPASPPRASS